MIDIAVTRQINRPSRTLVKQLVLESRLRELAAAIERVEGALQPAEQADPLLNVRPETVQ